MALLIKNKEAYYRAASDWAYDMYQSQTVWLRRALLALIILALSKMAFWFKL